MGSTTYVQYGCGLSAPESWINFDSSPRLLFERMPGMSTCTGKIGKRLFPLNVRFGDIVRGLPLSDESADAVYASHVLEHLPRAVIPVALSNTLRILKSRGVFRVIVPDLAWRVERYLRDRQAGQDSAADRLMTSCLIGDSTRPIGLMGHLRAAFGNSGHSWMYDREQMTSLLLQAGFTDVRPCIIGDSGDSMFSLVEHPDRFFDEGHAEVSLQARKA